MELNVLNEQGKTVEAADAVFGREYNEALVHQIVVAFQANARLGTRAQLNRRDVHHSTKKPWRQKGTGRARSGMTSSPLWRKLQPEAEQEDVPRRYGFDLLEARCRCSLCRR